MRRIASSLIAALAIATLAACSSGGYGFGTSSSTVPNNAQLTGSNGEVNDFTLDPVGNAPISITATGYTGSGPTEEVVPFATFTWQASFAPKGSVFYKGPSPNGSTACGTPPETPAVPILQAGSTGTPFGLYGGNYSLLSNGHTANTVYIGVPLDPTTGLAVQPATGGNYCLNVVALNSNLKPVANAIVSVTNTAP